MSIPGTNLPRVNSTSRTVVHCLHHSIDGVAVDMGYGRSGALPEFGCGVLSRSRLLRARV